MSHVQARTLTHAVALLVGLTMSVVRPAAGWPEGVREKLVRHLESAEGQPLWSYRARRRLRALARHDSMEATLDAWTMLSPDGMSYTTISEHGSSLIRRRVLHAALDAERELIHTGRASEGRISTANYELLAVTEEDGNRVRIGIRPKRPHQMLVDGALLMEVESGDILEVEGVLSKRPSMWTRRVHIERRYERIAGVHVPVSMRSVADVLLAGRSSFEMTYCYVEINGDTVGGCGE